MIDRRRLLFTAAAGAGLAATGQVFAQTPGSAAGSASATLAALMDRIVQESLMTSPEILTSLGLDKGPAAPMKAMLDDRSQAKIDADKVVFRKSMADLKAIDRAALTGDDGVYYDTLEFFGDTAISGYDFPYGGAGFGPAPYTISQMTRSY